MARNKDEAKIIIEKIDELNVRLTKHKENLIEVFNDVYHPEHDFVLSQFDVILNNWNALVEVQRIMLNKLEQNSMLNSIEIIGLPEEYGTDMGGVAMILSKLLHIAILETYITGFKRFEDINAPDPEPGTGNPRPLIVTLIDQNIKKRILTVAESVELNIVGSDRPMYIIEHLTLQNQQLLKMARQEALRHHINNVWVEDGKILVRRSDRSLVYEIQCEDDIKRMAHY